MDPIHTTEWVIRVGDASVDRLVIDFAATRTRLLRVALRAGQKRIDLPVLGWRADGPCNGSRVPDRSTIWVAYSGDAPRIASISWVSAKPVAGVKVVPAVPQQAREQ